MTERFRKSFETQKIEDRLRSMAIGEIVSYADLAALIGSPVDGSCQPLNSARAMLERSGDYVFATMTKEGVKRLSDREIVADTQSSRQRIARQAKRAMRRLSNIKDFNALSDDEKRQHQAHAVIYAAIAEQASSGKVRQLLPTVNVNGQAMLAAIKEAART